MDAQAVVKALGALAQEHRLAAFRLLVQAGEEGMPAGAITVIDFISASERRKRQVRHFSYKSDCKGLDSI